MGPNDERMLLRGVISTCPVKARLQPTSTLCAEVMCFSMCQHFRIERDVSGIILQVTGTPIAAALMLMMRM